MRTYRQAVSKLATADWYRYMSGDYRVTQTPQTQMVAFIFGKTVDRVEADTDEMVEKMIEDHLRTAEA